MLTAEQFDILADPITSLYTEYETSVIEDIARRLKNIDFSSAAWQVQRLTESGALYKDVLKKLSQMTGKSEETIAAILKKAGVTAINFDDKIYKAAGLNPLPLNLSPAMLNVLRAGLEKTNGVISNLTMTTAITAQQSFIKAADLAYMQVSTGAMSYDQALRAAIKQVASEGITTIDYASGHRDKLDVALRRTVLTGVSQTTGQIQTARAAELGSDLVQVSAHVGARNTGVGPANHESWQGKIFSISGKHPKYPKFADVTGYGTGEGLGGWNCVIGETLVSSPAIRAAYRREYSGEIIVIYTAGGKQLTVTPNHPILTDHGWVAANVLALGDYVICASGSNGDFRISPDVDQSESRIEDVFDSLCVRGKRFDLPISSSYFHGDISNGKVEIVFADSLLGDNVNSYVNQEVIKFGLSPSVPSSRLLITESAFSEVIESSLHSANGIMSGVSEFHPISVSHFGETVGHCLGAIVGERNAQFAKIPSNSPFGYSSFSGDFILPHAGTVHGEQLGGGDVEFSLNVSAPVVDGVNTFAPEAVLDRMNRALILVRDELKGMIRHIQLDYIVSIERKSFTGHVYNLQTEGEWYSANGIITHNCRHSFYPFFEGISEPAHSRKELTEYKKETVKYNDKEIPMYDATQYQRAIERKIRYWKRQAAAMKAGGLESVVEDAKVKQWQSTMRDFIQQTDLQRQQNREVVLY